MLTSNDIKRLRSLREKSERDRTGTFAVEGDRAINELKSAGLVPDEYYSVIEGSITAKDLSRITSLKTPQGSFAVFRKPFGKFRNPSPDRLSLVLDTVQDPGNLGTIIRTCDWFGVDTVFASKETADCFNPKVVQATMGAIARVAVFYTDLEELLSSCTLPVYGTFMDNAENIFTASLPEGGALLVMGNEGNGISTQIERLVTRRITIPSGTAQHVESLNVSVAAAIAVSQFASRR